MLTLYTFNTLIRAKFSIGLMLVSVVLAGCLDTQTPSGTGRDEPTQLPNETRRQERLTAASRSFEDGCLNPAESMRAAYQAFDANRTEYTFLHSRGGKQNSVDNLAEADLLTVGGRYGSLDDGDRRLLGCQVTVIGLYAKSFYRPVVNALKNQGFRAVKPLEAPTGDGSLKVEGTYTRNGTKYRVVLQQAKAKNPTTKATENVRYIRGNSRTRILINAMEI